MELLQRRIQYWFWAFGFCCVNVSKVNIKGGSYLPERAVGSN